MDVDIDLSDAERKAIASLKRLAKRWPKTLWLFTDASSPNLAVMRCTEEGARFILPNDRLDPGYMVAEIPIQADGGDW